MSPTPPPPEYFLITYHIVAVVAKMTLFQKCLCLSLCCLAYCKTNISWHFYSNIFLLVTRSCSLFFFKCLLIVCLETATLLYFRSLVFQVKLFVEFFFASPTIFLNFSVVYLPLVSVCEAPMQPQTIPLL